MLNKLVAVTSPVASRAKVHLAKMDETSSPICGVKARATGAKFVKTLAAVNCQKCLETEGK